ncbi:NERD domain-containing protein [Sporosarcina sp. Marseille-Q4063]|uniref:nuclease-related domain-containing protein n=1 Tax=Sporosarcina sp. Marseille-Q4063 TaxID=2810514 RepID=UPI001BAF3B67|nr:nuclease-related domain-containing protein [Sporosarcina sp. Marseille-Q4063]QUW20552.1 NERD domain-containing protein [Sporosarcina sp. Marseille-Q4063]
MIIKKNAVPFKLRGLEALDSRLSLSYKKKSSIAEELRIVRAGVNGEKILTNVFQKYSFLDPHYIFHDLNLKSTGLFQLDTLFLSRHGAVIFEMKNIAGKIRFLHESKQLMRTLDNGQIDVYECPSVQLERNKFLLEDWFYSNGLKDVPIRGAAVFPNPRQHFENIPEDLTLLFPLEVPVYLRKLMKSPPILDIQVLDLVAKSLLVAHREYDPFPICEKYKIDIHEIMIGVRCHQCGLHEMTSTARGWGCKSCKYFSRDAYKHAVLDYFMLFGNSMTNRQCREFLHLSSGDKTTRLLKQMNLSFQGENKGRKYSLSLNELEKQLLFLKKE